VDKDFGAVGHRQTVVHIYVCIRQVDRRKGSCKSGHQFCP
jgi:hypothetical protein